MVGKTHSHVLFSLLLVSSSLVQSCSQRTRTSGLWRERERERESGRPMVYYYYIHFGPTCYPRRLFIREPITSKPADKQTDTQTQTKGAGVGGFFLSAGCVAWSVGRRMAGWRAPGRLGSWPPRGPHFKERGVIN
jgi:hypothetical protein